MHLFPTQNRFHIICCFDILSISLIYITGRLRVWGSEGGFGIHWNNSFSCSVFFSTLWRRIPPPPSCPQHHFNSKEKCTWLRFSRMWCITTKRKQETEMLSLVDLSIHDSCSLTSRNNPIVCYRATFTRKFTSAVSVPMKGIVHTVVNTALCWLTVYERMQGVIQTINAVENPV